MWVCCNFVWVLYLRVFAIEGGLSGTPHLLYTGTCLGSLRDYFGTLTVICTSISIDIFVWVYNTCVYLYIYIYIYMYIYIYTPQLTKFDDGTYLNRSDEQDKITKERIKEIEIRNLASTTNNYYNTTTMNKAMYDGPLTTPGPPPPGPPPPASKPQMNAAGTQTVLKPTQTQSSGSGDPYFSGVGGGYQPPPAPPAPPPQGAAAVNPANPSPQNLKKILQEEYQASIMHIAEIRRMRDDIHNKFMDDINVDFGGGKKPTASQMTDVVMGTGGGGPRGPPPGSAGFVRTAVDHINNKRQPVELRKDSPRGKRGGPKPGPRPEIPMYEPVQPIQPINPLHPPVYIGGSRAYKAKDKPAYEKK
jgi:hypothetical protein